MVDMILFSPQMMIPWYEKWLGLRKTPLLVLLVFLIRRPKYLADNEPLRQYCFLIDSCLQYSYA